MAQPGSAAMPKARLKWKTPTGVMPSPSLVLPRPFLPMKPGEVMVMCQLPSGCFSWRETQAPEALSSKAATTRSCSASFAASSLPTHSGEGTSIPAYSPGAAGASVAAGAASAAAQPVSTSIRIRSAAIMPECFIWENLTFLRRWAAVLQKQYIRPGGKNQPRLEKRGQQKDRKSGNGNPAVTVAGSGDTSPCRGGKCASAAQRRSRQTAGATFGRLTEAG